VSGLTRETFVGPWAGLPVAWDRDDRFDEETYRGDLTRLCRAGVPGVYCTGTTGEFYALELGEFQAVARATVEQCHAHGTAAMVGCGTTFTGGVVRRVEYAATLGADAVQVPLPYWLPLHDAAIVRFWADVAAAAGATPLSLYDTTRAKKTLTVAQHRAVKQAVPTYLMVKATPGTVGVTAAGCAALSSFINVFTDETEWPYLGAHGVAGACSARVYWFPEMVLHLWGLLQRREWEALRRAAQPLQELLAWLEPHFAQKGFTDTAYDRAGTIATGFLKTSLRNRRPYPSATPQDIAEIREWMRRHYPEMLSPGPAGPAGPG
jgi:dihydrodipicolinate synthase/N-acetylneuraminate lyase